MKRIFGKKDNNGTSKSATPSPSPHPSSPPTRQSTSPLSDPGPVNAQPPQFTDNINNQQPGGAQYPGAVQLPAPPRVTDVAGAIGWSAAMPALDTAYLLQLAEYCSTSQQASKDASKALRKEFKHAVPVAQERALRVLFVLMRNSDHRFRQQVAAKKFLDDLKELHLNKKTPDSVRSTLLHVLSALAWDYQRDADLSTITTLYNKLKDPSAPLNGAPLPFDDPLLAPSSVPYSRRSASGGGGGRPRVHKVPTDSHHLATQRALARETSQAATMLHEAVAFANAETDLKRDDLVQEFLGKVNHGIVELSEGMGWIHSLADRKREERVERKQLRAAEAASRASVEVHRDEGKGKLLGSNNPFKRMVEGSPPQSQNEIAPAPSQEEEGVDGDAETDEERTLALVLKAHSEGLEALKMYEVHVGHHRELVELREVQERSMLDTRFDRSKAGTPDPDGIYHSDVPLPGEGTSAGAGGMVNSNPYAAYLNPHKRQSTQETPPTSPMRTGNLMDEPADYTESPLASPLNLSEGAYGGISELGLGTPPRTGSFVRGERSATVGSEVLVDPTEPSDKALGKLRRVSVRENSETDAEERQRELEAKLRAKYARAEEAEAAAAAQNGERQ